MDRVERLLKLILDYIMKLVNNGFALPSGASTAANQASEIAVLNQIEANTSPGGGITSSGETSIPTRTNGTQFAAFDSNACISMVIVNYQAGGTTIEYRHVSAGGVAIPVPNGSCSVEINGILNTSDIEVRRLDQSNTQYTVYAVFEA